MSVTIEITERQLKIGVVKLGISIAMLLILGAFVVSLVLPRLGNLSAISIDALVFAIAFSVLLSGVRSFLGIIDWFEARKGKRND